MLYFIAQCNYESVSSVSCRKTFVLVTQKKKKCRNHPGSLRNNAKERRNNIITT